MKAAVALLLATIGGQATAATERLPVNAGIGSVWKIASTTTIAKESSTGSSTSNGQSAYLVELRGGAKTRALVVTPLPVLAGQQPSPAAFEFIVDAGLAPSRVANWDEVRRLSVEGAEKLGLPPKMVADAKAMYAQISDEAAAKLLISELPILALGQGTNLEVGRSFGAKDATRAENAATAGEAGTFTLVSLDRQVGRAVLTWARTIPSQPFSDAQRAKFRTMVENTNPKASTDLPAMSEEGRQSCRFDVDVASGLVARAECQLVGSNFFVNGGGSGIEHQTTHMTITQTLQKKP